MIDPRVQTLCDEFEIEIIHKSRYPEAGQTRAVGTLSKIISRHGIEHARLVMTTLAETENNKRSLEAAAFGAASDLIRAKPEWVEDTDRWYKAWDRCPVGELQALTHDLRGYASLRGALAGLIYERLWRAFGPRATQPDLLDERSRRNG
ncbi:MULTISPECIES: hypothetical protein [unclassified Mesorhizobium]|uniref:hypothetical protein n=1 Tax=unclassified Mesorhizobium TaxID=325217 RepID=UPI000FD6D6F9|nr:MULTISPECIES: hypothetical protein [unclassified Mesorhizobium]TGT76740.1 hypothetical protein EN809_003815 [Mesorhizobium sp. M2E.F.Ca.ET.166.01.1.1]TGW02852.1 hypothetical protein EN797_003815 [Mesorhizobium sp. M2E.F.Ca.ET.154.01.1.1]